MDMCVIMLKRVSRKIQVRSSFIYIYFDRMIEWSGNISINKNHYQRGVKNIIILMAFIDILRKISVLLHLD